MSTMPKAFPNEFREDVIRAFRDSDASMAQVAKGLRDLAVVPEAVVDHDDRNRARSSGSTPAGSESEALREANKRIKLLEQENEGLRRAAAYLSQAHLPGK
jgi:transposase